MATPEGEVIAGCIAVLRLRGVHHFRNNTGAMKSGKRLVRFGTPGWPDIIAVLPGHGQFVGIECKAPKRGKKPAGQLTDEQRACGAKIEAAGGVYLIVRNSDDLGGWLAANGVK